MGGVDMSMFGRKERKKINLVVDDHREESLLGVRTLHAGGFLKDTDIDIPEDYPGRGIKAYSIAYTFEDRFIDGSARVQLEELREYLRLHAIRTEFMRGKGSVRTFDLDALTDIAAFLIGNRRPGGDMTIAVLKGGIEMICDAEPAGHAGKLMNGSLEDAIEKLHENGNGYPIIEYDPKTAELTAAIFIPQFFKKPDQTRQDSEFYSTWSGGLMQGAAIRSVNEKNKVEPKEMKPLKYIK